MPDSDDLPSQEESTDFVQGVGRLGYAVYGVVHFLLGFVAVQLGLGSSSEEASTSGALRTLAQQPLGMVMLWVVVVGMALLVLWQVMEAVLDPDSQGAKARVKAAGRAVAYGAVAFVAFSVVTGSGGGGGGSGSGSEETLTARLLQLPAGRVLVVGLVGLGVFAVAGYHVYKGFSRKYLENLDLAKLSARQRQVVDWSGRVGYPAKGLAYGIVGVLFLLAAWTADSDDAGGLDEALNTLRDQPFGTVLLVLVGLGIGLFGVFCLARAKSSTLAPD